MTTPVPPAVEADEVVAPLIFLYMGGVIVTLFAALTWVYWFRGYA